MTAGNAPQWMENIQDEAQDLDALAGTVSSNKVAVKAASGDFADGSIATLGLKADTATTDSTTTNTGMSFIKGLVKILADAWDSTNHAIQASITKVTGLSLGDGVKDATTLRVITASDGPLNANLGATTDAAITSDANGTVSGKLRGLVKILASVWDSTNNRLIVQDVVASSNGAIPYHNLTAASTNFTNVKNAACQLYSYTLSNTSASAIYVKFYDKATTPATTDTPKRTVQVLANGTVIQVFPKGLKFTTGLGWAATGGVADNDNTNIAANCVVDYDLSA